MFDVYTRRAITLETVSLNVNPSGQPIPVEIYYKKGTYVGFESDPGAWTLVGGATVTSAGVDIPTPIPIDLKLDICAHETYALYITVTAGSILYTNGTAVGAIAAEDSNLKILQGSGIAYPFTGNFFPRIWNGTIHYCGPKVICSSSVALSSLPTSVKINSDLNPDADPETA